MEIVSKARGKPFVRGRVVSLQSKYFDVESFGTRFGGSQQDFDRSKYIEPKDFGEADIFMQYGIAAGVQHSMIQDYNR